MKRLFLFLPLFLGCSVTRPAALPAPSLGEPSPAVPALRVTDSTGRAQWIYRAWVDGDTLRGLGSPDMPRQRIAMPVGAVRAVAASRFSLGRTAGLIGGLLGAFAAAVLLAPEPVYGVGAP